MTRTLIAPSILAAGHFVPNLTIGPAVVKALRPHTKLPLVVHLMIAPVDPYVQAFRDAGADILTVHPEAGPHVHRTLQAIKASGARAGVSLNPGTPTDALDRFIEHSVEKIADVRRRIDASARDIILEVDGGVNTQTAPRCIGAGADALVAGTAVFGGDPAAYAGNIARLRSGA
jgi:ribulose-phosphate 3-epimerase